MGVIRVRVLEFRVCFCFVFFLTFCREFRV